MPPVARDLVVEPLVQRAVVAHSRERVALGHPTHRVLAELEALARRLQRSLRRVRVADASLTTSIGYAVFPEHGTTPEALLAHADAALWASKHETRRAEAS